MTDNHPTYEWEEEFQRMRGKKTYTQAEFYKHHANAAIVMASIMPQNQKKKIDMDTYITWLSIGLGIEALMITLLIIILALK